MTLRELLTEFYARGFDYLSADSAGETRAKRWINQAYLEIVESGAWPYAEQTVTGTAPLTIGDVRSVLSVTNSTQSSWLTVVDRRTAQDTAVDLTTAGTPEIAYFEGNDLHVFPVNSTDTITVRYLEVPEELVNDSDEPIIPERFQDLIIDGAVIRALKDSDNYEAMAALRQEYQQTWQKMSDSLLDRDSADPDLIVAHQGYWRDA